MLPTYWLLCITRTHTQDFIRLQTNSILQFNNNSPHCREIHECWTEALFSHQQYVSVAFCQLPLAEPPTFHFCCWLFPQDSCQWFHAITNNTYYVNRIKNFYTMLSFYTYLFPHKNTEKSIDYWKFVERILSWQ